MLSLDHTALQKLAVHSVGSKNNLEPLLVSKEALTLNEAQLKILQDGFLQKFRTIGEQYRFAHPDSLQFNEAYSYSQRLFADAAAFEEVSAAIARHLYEQSTHPKMKGGELYVAYFEGLPVDSRMHKAVGFFKTEHKSIFLDAQQRNGRLTLDLREGVEPGRIDKGCLVIGNESSDGYDVLIFDNQNRGEEAAYWKEKFLGLAPQQNDFSHTQHLLTLTRHFITDQLETELKVPKTEQAELLQKSMDYFRSKNSFDIDEFQQEVFGQEDRIESFRRFGSRYVENTDYDIASSFDISPEAVKKQGRVYKSVLKLDRNFHIYIHGRTDLIEKGVDLDGRKFYKIYYQDEA